MRGVSRHKRLPAQVGIAGGNKLRDRHVVQAIGTMTDQQLPGLVPAHDHPHMGGARVQRKIPR